MWQILFWAFISENVTLFMEFTVYQEVISYYLHLD